MVLNATVGHADEIALGAACMPHMMVGRAGKHPGGACLPCGLLCAELTCNLLTSMLELLLDVYVQNRTVIII